MFPVGCTDGSADTEGRLPTQKVKLKTWTIMQHGYRAKELTVRKAHRWIGQAELEDLKRRLAGFPNVGSWVDPQPCF
jgi:hypothetical protein